MIFINTTSVDTCGNQGVIFKYHLTPTIIEDNINSGSLAIYPNPSDGKFTIECNNITGLLSIVNVLGKTVFSKEMTENKR